MKSKASYIVTDTNVLISAGLLPESKTAQVLALAVEHFVIAQNQDTWRELETRIARPKFDRYFGQKIQGQKIQKNTGSGLPFSIFHFTSHSHTFSQPGTRLNLIFARWET